MNKYFRLFMLCSFLTSVISCDKVIDLKLKDASGKYVIEGNVTNLPGPYTVRITQTKAFNGNNQYTGIPGAIVIIKDNTGFSDTLKYQSDGKYNTKSLQGKIGNTYYLTVSLDDTMYTATSTMPAQVNMDTLYTRNESLFGKTVIATVPEYTDPKGLGNYYRFNQFINGALDKEIYYESDEFTDGQKITWSLMRSDPDSTLHVGDKVEVEMQCIDKAAYKYWYSLYNSSTGSPQGIASNPVTNIKGNALGYFSAHTSQTKSLTVE